MITTNHRGGLGNAMFKIATVIATARDNNVDYIIPNQFIRPGIDPDYTAYSTNIFRNVKFQNKLHGDWIVYQEPAFHYTPIEYVSGTNILLDGYFQSEKYFHNHKQYIIDTFKPTNEHKLEIRDAYPDVSNYVSVHIRRGDYLKHPDHHPQITPDYLRAAVDLIGVDRVYLIFSDDLDGCVDLVDFIPNKYIYTSGVDWMDMYIMSMCGDHIICNSTFSWWGAYLNESTTKKVVAPSNWFGPAYTHLDASDIYPSQWIKI